MNVKRLELMVTLLKEVEAGTWKPNRSRIDEIIEQKEFNKYAVGNNPTASKIMSSKTEFDLTNWFSSNVYHQNKLECGFSACAVGHASLDSRFNKIGLKPDWAFAPTYKGEESWDAVVMFFDVNIQIAKSLFSKANYPPYLKEKASVIQVRRRIEKLIEVGEGKYEFSKLCNFNADQYLVSPKGRIYKEYK